MEVSVTLWTDIDTPVECQYHHDVEAAPTITPLDEELVILLDGQPAPYRFSAEFADPWSTTLEIEFCEGRPMVRSLQMGAVDGDISEVGNLRLRSELVPAAVRAAVQSLTSDLAPEYWSTEIRIGGTAAPPTLGFLTLQVDGVPVVDGPDVSEDRPRRGRKRKISDQATLQRIADAYSVRRSIADVVSQVGGISRSTAYRYIREAKEAGVLSDPE